MVADTALYDLLNVDPTCSQEELKKAYKKASLANHPDKNPGDEDAHSRFQEINTAYETLRDPDSRSAYDRYGLDQPGGGGMGGGPDMDDIFAQMFGGGMGMGGGMGGMGGPGRRPKPRRGEDAIIDQNVTLSDLYNGRSINFNISKQVICPTCSGSGGKLGTEAKQCVKCHGEGRCREMRSFGNGMVGQSWATCDQCDGEGVKVRDKDRCKKCKGKKTVTQKKKLELKIERGMLDGQKIELVGENDEEPGVPEAGSIIFNLVLSDETSPFQLKGLDLLAKVHLTLAESLLGFSRVVLVHLDGRQIRITKRPGQVTKPGSIDRIEGEGMPRERDIGDRGDLFIQWEVDFPEDDWLRNDMEAQRVLKDVLPPSRESIVSDGGSETIQPTTKPARVAQWGQNQPVRPKERETFWEDETSGPQAGCAPS